MVLNYILVCYGNSLSDSEIKAKSLLTSNINESLN